MRNQDKGLEANMPDLANTDGRKNSEKSWKVQAGCCTNDPK